MTGGEQIGGWQAFPWAEMSSDLDALGFPKGYERSHIIPNASDTDTWGSNIPLEDTGVDSHPPGAPEAGFNLRQSDGEHLSSLEWARQNAPRSEQVSLPRRRSRYLLRQPSVQNQNHATELLSTHPIDNLRSLPIQRWRHSPPEEEAASPLAIYGALRMNTHNNLQAREQSREEDVFHKYTRPSSVTSVDSSASGSSVLSSTSAHSTISISSRHARVTKSRRTARGRRKSASTVNRKFKCTFCCDTFVHKFDWSRHEKSLHLNLEEWKCAPNGALVVRSETGRVHCAYCNCLDPDLDHLRQHNHDACLKDRTAQRSFRRKDHLVQHLRHVHKLDTMPLIEDWRVETMAVVSRCGFCKVILYTWEERTDHLTTHFRAGKTMLDWQGDHGFDPAVAARVTNSLPPYLIGSESLALVPFSATNPASIDHFKQISSQISGFAQEPLLQTREDQRGSPAMTSDCSVVSSAGNQPVTSVQELDTVAFADILTLHLSQFARKRMAAGIIPTDDMFQRESRRVLYGDEDDTWNTTVADNTNWLNSFREHSGFEKESGK